MGPDLQSKDPCSAGVLHRRTLVIIMQILSLVREESGLAKRIRSLWSAIYWVNPRLEGIESVCWDYGYKRVCFGYQQRLVDQANTILRNIWITELEIEELGKKVTGSDSVIVEEARSVDALPDHVGEDVRNVLPEMGAEEQADSLDEEEVAIVVEIAEVIERGRKDKLPVLRNFPGPTGASKCPSDPQLIDWPTENLLFATLLYLLSKVFFNWDSL